MPRLTPQKRYILAYRNVRKASQAVRDARIAYADTCHKLEIHDRDLDYILGKSKESNDRCRNQLIGLYYQQDSEIKEALKHLYRAKSKYRTASEYTQEVYWSRVTRKGSVYTRYGYIGRLPRSGRPWDVIMVGDDYQESYQFQFNPDAHDFQIDLPSKIHGRDHTKKVIQKIVRQSYDIRVQFITRSGCPHDFPRARESWLKRDRQNESVYTCDLSSQDNDTSWVSKMILQDLEEQVYHIIHANGDFWARTCRCLNGGIEASLVWYQENRSKNNPDNWHTVWIHGKTPTQLYQQIEKLGHVTGSSYIPLSYQEQQRILRSKPEEKS